MGSYCELEIGGCNIFSSKSHVVPEIMSLFCSSDRNYQLRKLQDTSPEKESSEHEESERAECKYQSPVATVKKRLDIIGFDLRNAENDFETCKQAEIHKFEDWNKGDEEGVWVENIKVLRESSFSTYIATYKEIFREHRHLFYYQDANRNASGLFKYILEAEYGDPYMGFPCSDIRFFFRVFLEVVEEESQVVLDMTELVNSGYYAPEEDIVSLSHQELTADYPINAKIIVLCEGSSDKTILERSIKLLYPDLYERYSFMDFNLSKAPGGAPALVQTIKAFMAAGIENRIIALFDNDTAAKSAVKAISSVKLPEHIKVEFYPEVEFLKSYPTIGPGGIQELDVNGLAGSIELYLGKDCLEGSSGLYPVQWKGYNQDLDSYHGEVLNKRKIQECFYHKIQDCEENSGNISNYDWNGLHMIISCIFKCFGGVSPNK